MRFMFSFSKNFNQSINEWNVSNELNSTRMFEYNTKMQHHINNINKIGLSDDDD